MKGRSKRKVTTPVLHSVIEYGANVGKKRRKKQGMKVKGKDIKLQYGHFSLMGQRGRKAEGMKEGKR